MPACITSRDSLVIEGRWGACACATNYVSVRVNVRVLPAHTDVFRTLGWAFCMGVFE